MTAANEAIESLKTIGTDLNNSINGYRQCADSTKDERMKTFFIDLSHKRDQMKQEIEGLIKSMGGSPPEYGSATGVLHRLFINIKSLLTGSDIDAIVNEIKRGENTLIEDYKQALRLQITPETSQVLNRHLQEIESNLAHIDTLSIGVKS